MGVRWKPCEGERGSAAARMGVRLMPFVGDLGSSPVLLFFSGDPSLLTEAPILDLQL